MSTTPRASLWFGVNFCKEGEYGETERLGTLTNSDWQDTWDYCREHNLENVSYGYDGDIGEGMAVKSLTFESEWSEVTLFGEELPSVLTIAAEEAAALKAIEQFCEKYEIPYEPKWHLTCEYL